MSYIGRSPTVGNFQICDAISTVNNQAAYTMQVGSVNVLPETANHMIVSLNGVIQAPISSFTISGSTITFAANLVTGDVINFIQILGDVLDLGVPSDGTVSTAKLATNAVTTVKITDGNVTLAKLSADSVNATKIANNAISEEHLDVTAITGHTAETSIADGDLVLIHDASASALRKITKANLVAGVGGTNTPAFKARSGGSNTNTSMANNTAVKIAFATEVFDSDNKFSSSRFTPTVAGKYFISAAFKMGTSADWQNNMIMIYKNGSLESRFSHSHWHYETIMINGIIDLDTDDYVEIYGQQGSGSTRYTTDDVDFNYFAGFKIIT